MINEVRRAQAGLCGDCAGMTAENVRESRSAGCLKLRLLDSGRAVWEQCRNERKSMINTMNVIEIMNMINIMNMMNIINIIND